MQWSWTYVSMVRCRWSEMLTPGPGTICKLSSDHIRESLWQNQLWLKRKAAAEHQADSDKDDTEQFGIQERDVAGSQDPESAAADEEEEADVYPLYGEDDSDYGDSSSEVGTWCKLQLRCCVAFGANHKHKAVQCMHIKVIMALTDNSSLPDCLSSLLGIVIHNYHNHHISA